MIQFTIKIDGRKVNDIKQSLEEMGIEYVGKTKTRILARVKSEVEFINYLMRD